MIRNKKQMYLVIGAFALVLLLGTTTYAFFNYTRTGTQNIIKTGRISFNSTQGTAMNLDNLFPIDTTVSGIMNDATKVGTVTINVTGDTTYSDGIEYLISAVNVSNTVGSGANAKSLPISIDVSVANNTNNDPATSLGTSDDSYFTNRGPSVATSIYKVLASDVLANNEELLVGYIKSGATGVDGNIVIKAYIDKEKVGISDTYPEQTVHTVKTTGYSSNACETALTGVPNASTYCANASALQSAIDGEDLTSAQITLLVNAGIVEEYTDGTPSSFGEDRTIFTTQEWNSLQQNGVSFQVKVEANEGTWVDAPALPAPTCPGPQCVYSRQSGTIGQQLSGTLGEDYFNDYSGFDFTDTPLFLSYILDNEGIIQEVYGCDTSLGGAVCFRGGVDESSLTDRPVFNENMSKGIAYYGEEMCYSYEDESDDDEIIDSITCSAWLSPNIESNGEIQFGDGYGGVHNEQGYID